MHMTIGSSLISITFRSAEKWVRLTNPAEWERAVRTGEILPDSTVVIEHGAVTEAADASDIEALAAYFRAPKLTLIEAMDSALIPQPPLAQEPAWAVAPAQRTA